MPDLSQFEPGPVIVPPPPIWNQDLWPHDPRDDLKIEHCRRTSTELDADARQVEQNFADDLATILRQGRMQYGDARFDAAANYLAELVGLTNLPALLVELVEFSHPVELIACLASWPDVARALFKVSQVKRLIILARLEIEIAGGQIHPLDQGAWRYRKPGEMGRAA